MVGESSSVGSWVLPPGLLWEDKGGEGCDLLSLLEMCNCGGVGLVLLLVPPESGG